MKLPHSFFPGSGLRAGRRGRKPAVDVVLIDEPYDTTSLPKGERPKALKRSVQVLVAESAGARGGERARAHRLRLGELRADRGQPEGRGARGRRGHAARPRSVSYNTYGWQPLEWISTPPLY